MELTSSVCVCGGGGFCSGFKKYDDKLDSCKFCLESLLPLSLNSLHLTSSSLPPSFILWSVPLPSSPSFLVPRLFSPQVSAHHQSALTSLPSPLHVLPSLLTSLPPSLFLFAHYYVLLSSCHPFLIIFPPYLSSPFSPVPPKQRVFVWGVFIGLISGRWRSLGGAGDKAAKAGDGIYQTSHSRAKLSPAEERGERGKGINSPSSDTGGSPWQTGRRAPDAFCK